MKATELLHILKVQNKRLFIMWLVTFIAFIGLLGYTLWLMNQYQYVDETEVTQDNENGYNNYIGNDGDITYGETKTLSQWSKEYNINIVTLSDRMKAGMTIEEALNKPVTKSGGFRFYTLKNETKLLSEWCKIYNINYQTAWKKAKKGYSIEKMLKISN